MRPYLRVANVFEDRIDTSDVQEMNFTPAEYEIYRLKPGDVLLNEGQSLELVGRPAIYHGEVPGACFQNTLIRFRAGPDVLPDYALSVFRHYLHAGVFQKMARWTTSIAHLGATRFAGMSMPVPPRDEQQRIVVALEERLTDLDAAVASLQRARGNLKGYRASVLDAGCEGRLLNANVGSASGTPFELEDDECREDLPKGWEWRTIASLASAVEYGTSSKATETGDVPVLRMGNLVEGSLDLGSLKYLPQALPDLPRLLLEPGDLLFNRTNSPQLVGKAAVYEGYPAPCSFASYLIRVRLTPEADPRYISAYLNSPKGRRWVAAVASQQVGQANVNGSKLKALRLPLPPRSEQHRLADDIDRRLAGVSRCSEALNEQVRRAASLRRSLLRMAFEGRLLSSGPA